MAEYIEREDLINKICNEKCNSEYGRCQKGLHDDKIFLCVCDFIMWQPAADVTPVRHGHYTNKCKRCGKTRRTWEPIIECHGGDLDV